MPKRHVNGVLVATTFVWPPIPDRSCDWQAVFDQTYDGAEDSSNRGHIGSGPTEAAAIADLIENYPAPEPGGLLIVTCDECGGEGGWSVPEDIDRRDGALIERVYHCEACGGEGTIEVESVMPEQGEAHDDRA